MSKRSLVAISFIVGLIVGSTASVLVIRANTSDSRSQVLLHSYLAASIRDLLNQGKVEEVKTVLQGVVDAGSKQLGSDFFEELKKSREKDHPTTTPGKSDSAR